MLYPTNLHYILTCIHVILFAFLLFYPCKIIVNSYRCEGAVIHLKMKKSDVKFVKRCGKELIISIRLNSQVILHIHYIPLFIHFFVYIPILIYERYNVMLNMYCNNTVLNCPIFVSEALLKS